MFLFEKIKKHHINILLLTTVTLFGVIYSTTILRLPLFGDATIHGSNANYLIEHSWQGLQSDYPAHYSYLMAATRVVAGGKGYNLVVFVGFLLLLISSFLLVRYITRNAYLGILAVIYIGCSPKIILYGARMYQEVLLSGLFILSIYLLVKYFDKNEQKILYLLAFLVGITLSIKQQGLFILYPTLIVVFLIAWMRRRTHPKALLVVMVLPALVGFGYYAVLEHNVGSIQPGSNEFLPLRLVNDTGQKLFDYRMTASEVVNNQDPHAPTAGVTLNIQQRYLVSSLTDIQNVKTAQANEDAESRQIWPWQPLTSFTKFNQANSLYVNFQGLKLEAPFLMYFTFAALIGGLLYSVLREHKRYWSLLIFTATFMPINYLLFARNTDQQRYQVFIPLFLLVYVFIFLQVLLRAFHRKYQPILYSFLILAILGFQVLYPRLQLNQASAKSQIYSPSIGGIASEEEAGNWIQKHTTKNDLLGQQCGNETGYYANRQVLDDWRIYFLNTSDLHTYFKEQGISYYVVYESQLVPDPDWSNGCTVPDSFYQRLEANFPLVYTTSAKDIYIYRVEK